jgi:hypothetical protein
MENAMKGGTEQKDVHGANKKPYTSPKVTVHGDVHEVTKVLRLAGAKGRDASIETFL